MTLDDRDIFRGTYGPKDAKLMIVAESWGAQENAKKRPLIGKSGEDTRSILRECGIDMDSCFLTNVINEQPYNNDMKAFFVRTSDAKSKELKAENLRGLYPKDHLIKNGLLPLYEQIKRVKPRVILGFGNYTLWALTQDFFSVDNTEGFKVPSGITNRRGSQLLTDNPDFPATKLIPTIHPAAIQRTPSWRRLIVHDIKARVKPVLEGRDYPPEDYNFLITPTLPDVLSFISSLLEKANKGRLDLSVDLETRGYLISCVGIAHSSRDVICIPFMTVNNKYGYWGIEEEFIVLRMIQKLFTHPNVYLFGQNFLYDMYYIPRHLFCFPKVSWDTMLAWHVCWPGDQKALHYLSSMLCRKHKYWKDEGKEWEPWMGDEQHWIYNCKDAVATYEVWEQEKVLVSKMKYEPQVEFIMDSFDSCLDMMFEGCPVDMELRANFKKELQPPKKQREEWLEAVVSKETLPRNKKASPWYTSPKQQMYLLYDILGLPKQYNRKAGKKGKKLSLTINEAAMDKLEKIEPLLEPIFLRMRELRSINVFDSTFVDKPVDLDGKLRCFFSPTAKTFRWISKENPEGYGGNLMNIPQNIPED